MIKKIGVLTSGGDCAGLNAAVRAIVHRATGEYGWEVYGVCNGTTGLINRPLQYRHLSRGMCDTAMLRAGGTMLGTTNKANPFAFPGADGTTDRSDECIAGYKELGLDALIGIGGDGSLDILQRLAQKGNINLVAIPKTIDNDLGLTENAIGYSTAVETAMDALDHLQPTAASHQRVMVLEVMGRDAGHIAIAAGIAGGADVILVPEIFYSIDTICQKIKSLSKTESRNFALIIVAEAVKDENGEPVVVSQKWERIRYGGIGHYIGDKIAEKLGADVRVTSLGHIQRGGQPNALDRIIASAFGVYAVDLLAQGKFDRMVAWQNRQVIDVAISDAVKGYQSLQLDDILVKTARGLGICLGD
ncbi:ATP-dependent 6-phosphofructokinase [Candidatus Odyssella acanthamoebae]|uniref:ATP-dependent 6-phosphofructokinase n=1 Tax=Candidatus Odyssella acanthamoebae TaxID=91604 RepID=A0A077AYE3_9PROT|nr:ATP-dependent 6-phosphofructokinase [Candidatus Paracaedibacter acanthamoebae]AIK95750.1 6-phosphofructokinase [Candidatus Paracaedibacter acanthamoebae]